MKCKKCGTELPNGAKFCFTCGAKVETELFCMKCGTKLPAGAAFCFSCGSQVSAVQENNDKGFQQPKAAANVRKADANISKKAPTKEVHGCGKEYYGGDVDYDKTAYRDRIYYMNGWYLVSSAFDGTDIKVLVEEKDLSSAYICVNDTGIYLYVNNGNELRIKYYDFNGKQKKDCTISDDGNISNVYIYDRDVYYSSYMEIYSDGRYIPCGALYRVRMSTGTKKCLYNKASEIDRVLVDGNNIIIHAKYSNINHDKNIYAEDEGWMLINSDTGALECLSSDNCSPDNAFKRPAMYDEDSPEYISDKHKIKISYFDFERGIYWQEKQVRKAVDGKTYIIKYVEPRYLWKRRGELVDDMKTWENVSVNAGGMERSYFDGIYHFRAPNNRCFGAVNEDGEWYKWGEEDMYGNCHKFLVLGQYLFLDLDALTEDQYKLSYEYENPVRSSWFNAKLPE